MTANDVTLYISTLLNKEEFLKAAKTENTPKKYLTDNPKTKSSNGKLYYIFLDECGKEYLMLKTSTGERVSPKFNKIYKKRGIERN